MFSMVNLPLDNLVFELRNGWLQNRILQVFFHASENMFPKYLFYTASTLPKRRFLQVMVSLITSVCVRELHHQTLGGFMYMFWVIFSLPLQQKAFKCHKDGPLEGRLSQEVIITLGKATQELVVVSRFPFLLINCSYLWLKVSLFTVDWRREEIICY